MPNGFTSLTFDDAVSTVNHESENRFMRNSLKRRTGNTCQTFFFHSLFSSYQYNARQKSENAVDGYMLLSLNDPGPRISISLQFSFISYRVY